jgi:tetratricopeptide (TPR) repeat protein
MGRVHEEREDWGKALEHYQKFIESAPQVEAYQDVARVLRRADRWDEAEKYLLAAREKFPQSPEPMIELARMAQRTQHFDRAEEWFRNALQIAPQNASAHVEIATLYLGLGRREDAEGHFREATNLDPHMAKAYVGWATSLRGQQRFTEAVAALRSGLRSVPGDVRMLNLLARILATAPDEAVRKGAEAVALAEEADRKTQHSDYEILDTLAAAYAEAGRWKDAIESAQTAIQFAEKAGDAAFVDALHRRLEGYRRQEPLREITTTVRRSRS